MQRRIMQYTATTYHTTPSTNSRAQPRNWGWFLMHPKRRHQSVSQRHPADRAKHPEHPLSYFYEFCSGLKVQHAKWKVFVANRVSHIQSNCPQGRTSGKTYDQKGPSWAIIEAFSVMSDLSSIPASGAWLSSGIWGRAIRPTPKKERIRTAFAGR